MNKKNNPYPKISLADISEKTKIPIEALVSTLENAGFTIRGNDVLYMAGSSELKILSKEYVVLVNKLHSKVKRKIKSGQIDKIDIELEFIKNFTKEVDEYSENLNLDLADDILNQKLDNKLIVNYFYQLININQEVNFESILDKHILLPEQFVNINERESIYAHELHTHDLCIYELSKYEVAPESKSFPNKALYSIANTFSFKKVKSIFDVRKVISRIKVAGLYHMFNSDEEEASSLENFSFSSFSIKIREAFEINFYYLKCIFSCIKLKNLNKI